jgi:hypothetical protein
MDFTTKHLAAATPTGHSFTVVGGKVPETFHVAARSYREDLMRNGHNQIFRPY